MTVMQGHDVGLQKQNDTTTTKILLYHLHKSEQTRPTVSTKKHDKIKYQIK